MTVTPWQAILIINQSKSTHNKEGSGGSAGAEFGQLLASIADRNR